MTALNTLLEPPGATVALLSNCFLPDQLHQIEQQLRQGNEFEHGRLLGIIRELQQRQSGSVDGHHRGTKRKATGVHDQTTVPTAKTTFDQVQRPPTDTERDAGLGISNIIYSFQSIAIASPSSILTLNEFKEQVWNPLLALFRSTSLIQDDPNLPDALLNASDMDMNDMRRDSVQLETRVINALNEIVGTSPTDPDLRDRWLEALPKLFCLVTSCQGCDGAIDKIAHPGLRVARLGQDSLVCWMRFARKWKGVTTERWESSFRICLMSLRILLNHAECRGPNEFEPKRNSVMEDLLVSAYRNKDRRVRLAAA